MIERGRCSRCGHTVGMHTGGTITHYCEVLRCRCMGYELIAWPSAAPPISELDTTRGPKPG